MSNIGGCPLYQERGKNKYCRADANWNKFNYYRKGKDSIKKHDKRLLCYGKFSKCQNLESAAKYLMHRN